MRSIQGTGGDAVPARLSADAEEIALKRTATLLLAALITAGCKTPGRHLGNNDSSGYSYAYTQPMGTTQMTRLRDGDPSQCQAFFHATFVSGSAIQIPTNATDIGRLLLIHGAEVRCIPILCWDSEDGQKWYVVDHFGARPQLRAHSPRDLVSQIDRELGQQARATANKVPEDTARKLADPQH
jgi:hypothetical protein